MYKRKDLKSMSMQKWNVIFNKDNEKLYVRIKRKVQVLLLLVSLMSGSLLMIGCSKVEFGTETNNVLENQDETKPEPSVTTTPSEEGESIQEEEMQEPEENASEQGDKETDTSKEDGSNTNSGQTSVNENQEKEETVGQNTSEPFFATEEGKKLYEVVDAFTNAYLNQDDDVAKEYVAKDEVYEGLDVGYTKFVLLDLKLYSYDETTKDALLSYTIILNGEDSYTYLTMETVYEDGAYKVSMYGLEK